MTTIYDVINRGSTFGMGLDKDQVLVRNILITGVSVGQCKWNQFGLPAYRQPHPDNEEIVAASLHAREEPDGIGAIVSIEYVTPDVLLSRTDAVRPEAVEGTARLNSHTQTVTRKIPFAYKTTTVNPGSSTGTSSWAFDYDERPETVTIIEASWLAQGLKVASLATMHNQVDHIHIIGNPGYLVRFLGGSVRQIDIDRWEITASWEYDGGTKDIGGGIEGELLWPEDMIYAIGSIPKPGNGYIRGQYQSLRHSEAPGGGSVPIEVMLYEPYVHDHTGWQSFPGAPDIQ